MNNSENQAAKNGARHAAQPAQHDDDERAQQIGFAHQEVYRVEGDADDNPRHARQHARNKEGPRINAAGIDAEERCGPGRNRDRSHLSAETRSIEQRKKCEDEHGGAADNGDLLQ